MRGAAPSMLDGLEVYEIALGGLGIALFLLALALVVVYAKQRRSLAVLLPFFALTILMIGFPALQKFRFTKDGFELVKETETVEAHPDDAPKTAKLEGTTRRVDKRPTRDPQVKLRVARAYDALHRPAQALRAVNEALKLQPDLPAAKEMRKSLEQKLDRAPPLRELRRLPLKPVAPSQP